MSIRELINHLPLSGNTASFPNKRINPAFEKIQRSRNQRPSEAVVQRSSFRDLYEKPLHKAAKNFPLSANETTVLGIALSLIGTILNEKGSDKDHQNKLLALIGSLVFLIGWALDLFDGIVARAKNQESDFGAKLDTAGDHIVDGFPALVNLQKAKGRERAAWLTNEWIRSIPRIMRHEAVGAGQKVPELRIGSRFPRTGMIYLRSLVPEKYKEALVWVSNAAALLTSIDRFNILKKSGNKEAIQNAYKTLGLYTLSFIGAELSHLPANHLIWELAQLIPIWQSKNKELKQKNK